MPPSEHELRLRERLSRLRNMPLLGGAKLSGELDRLQRQLDRMGEEPTDEEIWRSVELARHEERPYTLDYVERLLDDWFELHGDRGRADDGAMIAGLGKLDGRTVALVGQQKGRDIQERAERRFGMPNPEGYQKAMRVMELADRHGFPVISLVDTPGAYPGVAAEQHGQGGDDRRLAGGDGAADRADRRLRDRRGRLRRRDRDRARRPGADAGERDLLGDLARGLRDDPLARRRRGEEGRGRVQARRRPLPRARRDRRDRPRAAGRRPRRIPTRRPGCSARRSGRRSTSSSTSRATSSAAAGGRSSARSASSRRFRQVSQFARIRRALSTASTGLSPACRHALKTCPRTTRGRQSRPRASTPRWVEKTERLFSRSTRFQTCGTARSRA